MAKACFPFLQIAPVLAKKARHCADRHGTVEFSFSHNGDLEKGVNKIACKFAIMQRKEGLVHVLTGDGNGKTTSAVGVAVRAAGRGMKVAFIQFLKGGLSSELAPLKKLSVTVISGTKYCPNAAKHAAQLKEKGFIVFCKDCFAVNEEDKKLVGSAFKSAQEFSSSGKYGLVILDEIFWAILEKLISEDQLLSLIQNRHPSCELILTGRGATQKIESASDYVTYVNKIRHPFDKGILSRSGIDY